MLESIWNFLKPVIAKAIGMGVALLATLLAQHIPGFDLGLENQEAIVAFLIGLIGILVTNKTSARINPANAATPELIAKGKEDQVKMETGEYPTKR